MENPTYPNGDVSSAPVHSREQPPSAVDRRLAEDGGEVVLDRDLGAVELGGDLLIGHPASDAVEDQALARAQPPALAGRSQLGLEGKAATTLDEDDTVDSVGDAHREDVDVSTSRITQRVGEPLQDAVGVGGERGLRGVVGGVGLRVVGDDIDGARVLCEELLENALSAHERGLGGLSGAALVSERQGSAEGDGNPRDDDVERGQRLAACLDLGPGSELADSATCVLERSVDRRPATQAAHADWAELVTRTKAQIERDGFYAQSIGD